MGQCHIAYCLFVYCNILLYCNMGHLEQKSSEIAFSSKKQCKLILGYKSSILFCSIIIGKQTHTHTDFPNKSNFKKPGALDFVSFKTTQYAIDYQ